MSNEEQLVEYIDYVYDDMDIDSVENDVDVDNVMMTWLMMRRILSLKV